MCEDRKTLEAALRTAESEVSRLRKALEQKATSPEKSDLSSNEPSPALDSPMRLTEVQGMLRMVLDHLPVRVFWKDRDLNYLGCNKRFAQDTGVEDPDKLVGKNDFDMVWAEQAELYQADDRKVMEEGKCLYEYEEPQTTPQGNTIWLRTTKIPLLDSQGNIVGVMGTYEDISVRKEAELAIIDAKNAAEESNRAKSEFLAMMSHEIRTPLNAILGFSQLLGFGEEDPERLRMFDLIDANGENLIHIIDDILDLAKIESGKVEVEEKAFDPKLRLERVVHSFEPKIKKKGLACQLNIESTLPDKVFSDEMRWGQIVSNLLSNAVKFTSEGTLTVHLSSHAAEGSSDKRVLRLVVRDTGIGISEEQMPRLFQPFSQADTSTTRKYGGTGLGLVLCQRFSRLLGGDIQCESNSGKGATFTVDILVSLSASL